MNTVTPLKFLGKWEFYVYEQPEGYYAEAYFEGDPLWQYRGPSRLKIVELMLRSLEDD
jgi:hypothetical protein